MQHNQDADPVDWKDIVRMCIAEVRSHPDRYLEAQQWFRGSAKRRDTYESGVESTPLYPLLGKIRHWTSSRYRPDLDPIARNAREQAKIEALRIIYVAWLLGDLIDAPEVLPNLLPWENWHWPEGTGDTRWTLAEDEPSSGWTQLVSDALAIMTAGDGAADADSLPAKQPNHGATAPTHPVIDKDEQVQAPALTESQRITLCTLATFDPLTLASSNKIYHAMDSSKRVSVRTINDNLKSLIELGFAERPEGNRQGARATVKGRRLVPKIAD